MKYRNTLCLLQETGKLVYSCYTKTGNNSFKTAGKAVNELVPCFPHKHIQKTLLVFNILFSIVDVQIPVMPKLGETQD